MEPFRFKQFAVSHSRSPMRVGTDAVTLGAIAPARGNVLDAGCGCGIIGLMLAQRGAQSVTMVDIDAPAAEEAADNARTSPWADRITTVCADFLTLEPARKFDSIVSNPPFFGAGILAPDLRRAAARSDSALPPEAFMQKAAALLAPQGTVSVIIPADRRQTWLAAAAFACLHPREIIDIKTKATAPPKRTIMIFATDAPDPVRRELLLNSTDYKLLTDPFYL